MRLTLLLLCVATLSACIHVESTKEAALKASAGVGEAVGKTSSEFVKGVKDGIDQTFNCHLVLAENLQKAQITTGKYFITSDSGSTTRNKVSAYLIFNKNGT